jgi:DNA polymerase-3 subunit epsilon
MRDFVAIDFETANQHRSSVCSVGIVVVRDGAIVEKFYRLIKPAPNFYSYWNTRCHGLCYEDTVRAGEFPEVWAEIAPKIEGLPLVAHNKSFDEQCLRKCHEVFGMQYPEYEFFCTLVASRRHFPNLVNHQLHTVSAYVGFELQHHHHALADSEACAAIALKIL